MLLSPCRALALSFSKLALAVIIALGVLVTLVGSLPATAADIRDTKHNLSGKTLLKASGEGAAEEDRRLLEREVCIFCHTPTLLGAGAPAASGTWTPARWQPALAPGFAYELFDDIGRFGAEGVDPVGSVSMACLSCHDSNQAFGVGGSSGSAEMDHPFGVPYLGLTGNREEVEEARRRLSNDRSIPFRMATSPNVDASRFHPAQSALIGGRRVWWASATPAVHRSKSDLPLYPRHNPEAPVASPEQVPFVECTSCHDPHTTRNVFLRRSNTAGGLCLTCHAM